MTTINVYDKGQVDTIAATKANTSQLPSASQLVPSAAGATEGQVLGLNANLEPVWMDASGGDTPNIAEYADNSPTLTQVTALTGSTYYRSQFTLEGSKIASILSTMLAGWADGTYTGQMKGIGSGSLSGGVPYKGNIGFNFTVTITNGSLTLNSPANATGQVLRASPGTGGILFSYAIGKITKTS